MLSQLIRSWSFGIFVIAVLSVSNLSVGGAQESSSPVSDQPYQDATRIVRKYEPVVGQAHPDFILPSIVDSKGGVKQKIQLSDFRGKKVLLLHFASW